MYFHTLMIYTYIHVHIILYNILSTWHRIEMNKISPCPGHADGISYGAKFWVPLSAWNVEIWAFLLGTLRFLPVNLLFSIFLRPNSMTERFLTIQLVNLQTFSFNLADCQVFQPENPMFEIRCRWNSGFLVAAALFGGELCLCGGLWPGWVQNLNVKISWKVISIST